MMHWVELGLELGPDLYCRWTITQCFNVNKCGHPRPLKLNGDSFRAGSYCTSGFSNLHHRIQLPFL